MKGLNKAVLILSKALEILHWVACGFLAVFIGILVFAKDWIVSILEAGIPEFGTEVKTYGLEMTPVLPDGTINVTMIIIFAIGAIVSLALMAMVFRNIYLVVKKSRTESPFCKDNVRMIREIGIFSIAVPVVGLIMSIIAKLVVGVDVLETSVSLDSFVMGIVILALTNFFAHGAKLEKDVDGLV